MLFKVIRAALLGLFCVQAGLLYLAQQEVELPESVCDWLAEKASPDGMRVKIGSGTLRRLVFLELNDVTISHATSDEALISAQAVGAFFNWKNFTMPGKNAQFFFCDDVRVNCPASRSRTGETENIIADGKCEAAYSFGEIRLRNFFAHIAGIPVSASGIFDLSDFFKAPAAQNTPETAVSSRENAPTVPEKTAVAAFYTFAKNLSDIKHQIATHIVDPQDTGVHLNVEPMENGNLTVFANVLCRDAKFPEAHLSLKNIYARTRAEINLRSREIVAAKPIRISAETLNVQTTPASLLDSWKISASNLGATLALRFKHNAILPGNIVLACDQLLAENFTEGNFAFSEILAKVQARNWTDIETLTLNFKTLNSPFAAQIDFNGNAGTRILLDGLPDFPRWKRLPQIAGILPEDVVVLDFYERPHVQAAVSLSPDWEFQSIDYTLSAGAATWKVVTATDIFATGTFTPDALDIRLAQVRGSDFCANAKVFVDFSPEKKYRVQAFGTIANPEVLDEYLDWFWWRIWKNLERAPSSPSPRADIDVYGSWGNHLRWEYIYGAVAAENAIGGGVPVDKVRLRIAEEPTFISAFDMGFEQGENTVSGTLLWNYALEPEYHYSDFRFAFSGTIAPHDVFNIVGEGLPEIFGDILERTDAASASASGFISGDTHFYPQERILVEVDVKDAPGDVSFLGIQGSDFQGKINYDTGNIRVSQLRTNCGGGQVSGNVLVKLPETEGIDGTQIVTNLKLQNISGSYLSETVRNVLPATDAEEADNSVAAGTSKNENSETDTDGEKSDDSRLSADIDASVTLSELDTLKATGRFDYHDPALFSFQFFGGFSRFLETIKIPLTSFRFMDASSTFSIVGGKIYLPDLKIESSSGEISAHLNMRLDDKTLVGEAVFKNRRGTNIPILGKAFEFFSESTSLFPLALSGTLDDVQWKARPFGNWINRNKENKGIPPSDPDNEESP